MPCLCCMEARRRAMPRVVLIVMLALGLSACATVPEAGPAPIVPTQPMASAYGKPGGLMGMDARHLTALFGPPRLDIRDRAVRKLQFANGRCVLDAYLYTTAKGREPVVSHVDARLPGGADTDPAACQAALQMPLPAK